MIASGANGCRPRGRIGPSAKYSWASEHISLATAFAGPGPFPGAYPMGDESRLPTKVPPIFAVLSLTRSYMFGDEHLLEAAETSIAEQN